MFTWHERINVTSPKNGLSIPFGTIWYYIAICEVQDWICASTLELNWPDDHPSCFCFCVGFSLVVWSIPAVPVYHPLYDCAVCGPPSKPFLCSYRGMASGLQKSHYNLLEGFRCSSLWCEYVWWLTQASEQAVYTCCASGFICETELEYATLVCLHRLRTCMK